MKKILALLLAAVMLLCLFTGCASSGSKVIKIGVFEPQSGDNGAGGKQEVPRHPVRQLRQAVRDHQWHGIQDRA